MGFQSFGEIKINLGFTIYIKIRENSQRENECYRFIMKTILSDGKPRFQCFCWDHLGAIIYFLFSFFLYLYIPSFFCILPNLLIKQNLLKPKRLSFFFKKKTRYFYYLHDFPSFFFLSFFFHFVEDIFFIHFVLDGC